MERLNPGIVAPWVKINVIFIELVINALLIFFLVFAFDPNQLPLSLLNAFCFYPAWIGYNLSVGYLLWSIFPNLYYDSNGLYLYFLRRRIAIPWDSIVTIKKRFLFNLIVCEKVTPVHYLYGFLLGWTLQPCIGISTDPKVSGTLLHLLKEHKKSAIVTIR